MSPRRPTPGRRFGAGGFSPAASLIIFGGACEGAAHLVRPLELQPVARALEDLEPERALDTLRGGLNGPPSERRILGAPQERGRCRDLQLLRDGRPGATSRPEVGAVVVEAGGQPA